MTYESKLDRTTVFAIVVTIALLVAGANYWIAGPVLLVLFLAAYPPTYELTKRGLAVRGALGRRVIPYESISRLSVTRRGVKIEYDLASELVAATEDPNAFFAELSARTPHLMRRQRGFELAAV
jgi:hypothetical protein